MTGIREGYKLSQTRFAALLGISVKTLRNLRSRGGVRRGWPRRVAWYGTCKWQQNTLMQAYGTDAQSSASCAQ